MGLNSISGFTFFMKKSFILHIDSLAILDDMNIEQKGILFDAIYRYHLGEDIELDFAMKMAFTPFKNQFIRDAENYEKKSETNRINGSKGGKRKVANATKRKRTQTNVADNDNDNDNDSDNDSDNGNDSGNDKNLPTLQEFLDYAKEQLKVQFPLYTFSLTAKYDSWVEAGWKDGNGIKIKNWKTKIRNTIPFLRKMEESTPDNSFKLPNRK